MTSCPSYPEERIPLVRIRRDGGTQVRAEMKAETVDEYAAAITDGKEFPPIVTFHDGEVYWLADGFHRVLAHEKAGLVDVLAEIRTGSKRDALLFAVGANATHGLARTNKDKRRAVEILLRDEEWAGLGDQWAAEHAGVNRSTVWRIREEFRLCNAQPESDTRTGKDGKQYPTRKAKVTTATPAKEAPRQHPLLDELEAAASLDELDAAFNKVATAGLDGPEAETAGDIRRRKVMEFRQRAGEVDADALVKRLASAVETMTYAQHEMVMDSIIAAHASKAIAQDQWAALDKAWWEKLNAIRREMAKTEPEKIGTRAPYDQGHIASTQAPAPASPPPAAPSGQASLFADAPAPVSPQAATAQPVSAAAPPSDASEIEALRAEVAALRAESAGFRQWADSVAARAGADDTAAVQRTMRLVALASSPNEHEAANAAIKACRMIRERGLLLATSTQTTAGTALTSDILEKLRQEEAEFWASMNRRADDVLGKRRP